MAAVIRTTPFHARLSELNTQGLYTHWQGYLSALRYTHSPKHEYFAVRNSVGVFDTSPLFKYRIQGPDAERFLAGVLVRDIRTCRPGQAQYTLWCDDRGYVMEDGVVFRHSATEFLLTVARPAFGWFCDLAGRLRVSLEDVSDDFGMLAVQGPRSRTVLSALMPEADSLAFFDLAPAQVASAPVTLSRTGYTGDLGFEITVESGHALDVLDAVLEAGQGHGIRPFGEEALMSLRIEAGLPLVDVEWHNSRLAFTDDQRVTPQELGMGWMLRGVEDGDRPFVGRDAIVRELTGTSRWATVGVVVDWAHWDRLHRDAGLLPSKDESPLPYESMLYDAPEGGSQVGFVTSFVYSPVLQRHIGLARLRPGLAAPGSPVHLEIAISHHTTRVAASTARLPLFNPARRTARP
ncbi:MAG: aminomethyl transferase family protein [Marmoricola sp.]|nr:aminomethyl transferase family protein [Marmoricola sp.]